MRNTESGKDIKKLKSFQYQGLKTAHGHPKERGRWADLNNGRKNNKRDVNAAGWRS